MLGLCKLISEQPVIELTSRVLTNINADLWVLEDLHVLSIFTQSLSNGGRSSE